MDIILIAKVHIQALKKLGGYIIKMWVTLRVTLKLLKVRLACIVDMDGKYESRLLRQLYFHTNL